MEAPYRSRTLVSLIKQQVVARADIAGPQIAWKTVFILEYIGPIFISPLIFYLRPFIFGAGATQQPSTAQYLTMYMVVGHFVKRELETLFVHRFSNATMPVANVFKNSGHYWLVSGILLALTTYGPNAPAASESLPVLTHTGLALYFIGELGNLYTHLVLRGLRSPGGTERGIPKGFSFDWVTCPNYMWETLSWIGIILVSKSWGAVVFLVLAGYAMGTWAWGKERRYRKELGAKYKKKRYAMLPGIL